MRASFRVIAGTVAGITLMAVSSAGNFSVANHAPLITGLDADATGNTATSLGPIDKCASLSVGQTREVDIWVQDVHDLLAWQSFLYFDSAIIRINTADPHFLLESPPGSTLYDASEDPPDSDGIFMPAVANIGPGPAYASGDGVLMRVTVEALAAGYSPMFPTGNILLDSSGQAMGDTNGDNVFDGETHGAILWVGSACPNGTSDGDQDGVDDATDNCDLAGNPDQQDRDGDGIGNWCDDADGDRLLDTIDTCPNDTWLGAIDTDGDGFGDGCDADIDGDGVPNAADNAIYVPNSDQADLDGDTIPDVLDPDADGDGVAEKTNPSSIAANIGGDSEPEVVRPGRIYWAKHEMFTDGDQDMDEVDIQVVQLGGSMIASDLDGDGEAEVIVKDPGLPHGDQQVYDISSQDPDVDVDIVVLGGGPLGALTPSSQDLDGDGEPEAVVWEPALMENTQLDQQVDGDADVDVRWQNGQILAMDNCPAVPNPAQANNDSDAYGDACDSDDDNDGYSDVTEAILGTGAMTPCGASGWPAELNSGTGSEDRVTLADMGSFFAPVAYFNTNVGANPGDERWDLIPGSLSGFHINLQDMGALLAGPTATPPMLGGVAAFNGPACPGLP